MRKFVYKALVWLPGRGTVQCPQHPGGVADSGRHVSVFYSCQPHSNAQEAMKQTPCKNIKWQWRRGLLKSVLWAYSNPKWPVEWVANWSIIPPSASTRGQNRPPTPPLGGGGPHSIYFRATGRLYTTIRCKSELPCHEHWLAIKTPNPKWPLARVADWPKMPQST